MILNEEEAVPDVRTSMNQRQTRKSGLPQPYSSVIQQPCLVNLQIFRFPRSGRKALRFQEPRQSPIAKSQEKAWLKWRTHLHYCTDLQLHSEGEKCTDKVAVVLRMEALAYFNMPMLRGSTKSCLSLPGNLCQYF